MRSDKKPTKQQLLDLYEAASVFKEAQPWKCLRELDIICVENPIDKVIGFCSIMGGAGLHYALTVNLGIEGFYGFCQLMDQPSGIPEHQAIHFQNSLICSFEDRDILTNEDRKQIKELGLSFRGRNAWPMFRRYEPGYYPWYINEDECIFLTHALRQTIFVAEKILSGNLKINLPDKTILRYSKKKNGELKWFSREMKLGSPVIKYSVLQINDELLLRKIKKAGKMGNVVLQADICYMPSAVQEKKGERPYFPRIFILAEKSTGLILDHEIYENKDDDINVTINRLVDLCLKNGIPREIHVRSSSIAAILDDLCKKTGIILKIVENLSAIDDFIEELEYRF